MIFMLCQVLLYKALGFEPPVFGHMSLILAPDKSKLSKRWVLRCLALAPQCLDAEMALQHP